MGPIISRVIPCWREIDETGGDRARWEVFMFVSTVTNTVDGKGRTSVPAAFREHLSEDAVYIWPSVHGPFLEGGGLELIEALQREIFDRVADGSLSPLDAQAQQTVLLGDARRLAYDKTGRLVLPDDFRDHANIDASVSFVGLGNRFEVWEPEANAARMEALRDRAKTSRMLGIVRP